jgi:ribonuclease R
MCDDIKKIEEEVLTLMRRKNYRPLSSQKLSALVMRQGHSPELAVDVLNKLESLGVIVRTKDGRLALPRQVNRYVGRLAANPDRYGFVQTVYEDIYVSGQNLNGAMHNDQVMVSLTRRGGGRRREGTVIKILGRANENIIGVIKQDRQGFFVMPLDRRIFYSFIIPRKLRGKAIENDIVKAKILDWPKDMWSCGTAEVVDVLGSESDPTIAVEVIISEHGLKSEFPKEVIAESERISTEVEEMGDRKDLRKEFTVTIDGLDAKDFDDAVSITKMRNGFLLKVHIADVSKYVSIHSLLDLEAKDRGFSVYLPDRVLPMLPERLSNLICSLNPKVDRLTVTVEMKIDGQGKIKRFDVHESVIQSNARLTYEEVDKAIEEGQYPDSEVKNLIEQLLELSEILEKKRFEQGSINFETVEPKIILGPENEPVDVKLRERTPATKIIEECMIVANESIARAMHRANIPMIYRIHDIPDEEQMKEIARLLNELEIPLKILSSEGEFGRHQKSIQKIIQYVHGRPEGSLINNLLLRAMKQARYSPISHSHYGLAVKHYTHFTSPIRRYPDLVVHRLVKNFLIKRYDEFGEEEIMELEKQLGEICDHCSVSEREADSAEREATDALLCRLLLRSVGDVFEGAITGVTDFGIFVQLPNSAEGLIRVKDMKSDFFRYEPEHYRLKGEKTGCVYRLGEKVIVRIISVNVLEQRIELMLEEDVERIMSKKT